MNIIGISAYFHDSACALIQDGKVICMISEERMSRIKNDNRLPVRAFRKILDEFNLNITDIHRLAYYEDPFKKLERQLASNIDLDFSSRLGWLDVNKPLREIRNVLGYEGEIDVFDHHLSHASNSFYCSPFKESAILTSDAIGEWNSSSMAYANKENIKILDECNFPNSVGLFYSAITNFLGFKVMSGEYKVMGLAPYGRPKFVQQLREAIGYSENQNVNLNMQFFDFSNLNCMYTDKLSDLFGISPRVPEGNINQVHKDIAKSLQFVLEEILLSQVKFLKKLKMSDNLCLSGGVALNCVAASKIRAAKIFKNIYIPPAPGDSGSSLGCAFLSHFKNGGKFDKASNLKAISPYIGPQYSSREISILLDSLDMPHTGYLDKKEQLYRKIARLIDQGNVIGIFQGRMECGPRALGSRSIIADPRRENMRDKINSMIKKRENFRPFAPAILEEYVNDYLENDIESQYMSYTSQVRSNKKLPAVTHIDGSCRPQTVSKKLSPTFYEIINAFYKLTGCAVVVNTSFNVRGEPIVCSPIDAIRCFANSNLDYLALDNFLIDRKQMSSIFLELAAHDYSYIKPPRDLFTRKETSSVYTFI